MPARTITHDGVTLTIKQWAQRTNQHTNNLRYRLDAGWPVKDALFQPAHRSGRPSFAPERVEQAQQLRAVKLRREFSKLVFELDNALRTFRAKLDALLPDQDTGGWVNQPENSPSDRTISTAQDGV
jgi:hypothetical protein